MKEYENITLFDETDEIVVAVDSASIFPTKIIDLVTDSKKENQT